MTESEIAKAQLPPIANQINRQQQSTMPPHQQQSQNLPKANVHLHSTTPSSSSTHSLILLQPGVRFDPKTDASVPIGRINICESNYQIVVEKFAKMTQEEAMESLSNGTIDSKDENGKALSDGLICGILVDPKSAGKYFVYLAVIADTDNWQNVLTLVNIFIIEFYSHLRQQCRQQLLYFFEEAIKLNIRQLDAVLSNFCRALSDGTEFRETCQSAQSFAQCLLANRQWISSLPPRSHLPSATFALFSRLIADAPNLSATGNGGNGAINMNIDNFKQPLISVCEFLIKERFGDLMLMGRDLVLTMMRLARIPQFVGIWRLLLHNPAGLMPKLTGIQQLLVQPPAGHILDYRVSVRISRKMAEILKNQHRAYMLMHSTQPNPGIAKAQFHQLNQELSRLFDSLKTIHLNGPDSGSIRAEIIRHVWAMITKEFTMASVDARSVLLGWLLKTAKPGAEMQWCKLVFFWEWYGFEPSSMPNAHINADPVASTIRHLLNIGQHQLCNSLVDFLIKSVHILYTPLSYFFVNSVTNAMKTLELANLQVQALFSNAKLDAHLREQMRLTFPDFFPKRVTSIADNLAEPSSIIDFDAIRGNAPGISPTTPTEPNPIPEVNAAIPPSTLPIGQQQSIPLINGKSQTTIGQLAPAKVKLETMVSSRLDARTSLSDEKLAGTVSKTTTDGQPAMKKAKLTTTESLPSTQLKRKMVKIEPNENVEMTASTEWGKQISESKKRKRVKLIETGAGSPKASKSFSQLPQNKLTPSTSAETIQQPPSTFTASEEQGGHLQIVDEEEEGGDDNEILENFEPEEGTSQRMPLSLLLPMVCEEFREPLESLDRAMKQERAGEEEAITAMQNLMDSIFDADEMENEQSEIIAICLVRIFDPYLHQKTYMPEDPSEENLDNAIEHPLYRFFKVLSQSANESESRRSLLAIGVKMRTECPRLGYLFLFYKAIAGREDRLGDNGPSAEQIDETYKALCELMEVDWTKQMALDLEQCHLDERDLFAHVVIGILKQMERGPPERVIRSICNCADPRMIAQLLSEIVRENIVIFGAVNVLQLLTDSLKWEAFEQFTLWQLLQTEAVEFDKFLELLPRLNYTQHPEATMAIMVILRNMEPNPEIQVMKDLLRNLLIRPPQRDMFTVDAIKLIIDYEENIASVADCISRMVKKADKQGDIMMQGSGNALKGKIRVLTVESVFGHLDRLRQNCIGKVSQRVEELLKHTFLLDMFSSVKKNPKLAELRSRFDELFTLFDIFLEDKPPPKGPKGKHRNAAAALKSSTKSAATGLNVRSFVR